MTKSFKELKKKLSPQAKAAVKSRVKKMLAEMPLHELRQAKHLSQEHLAEILRTKQANISRIERRADMYVSTLRSYIEAMGGELDIVAKFPEGNIHINQFKEIDEIRT